MGLLRHSEKNLSSQYLINELWTQCQVSTTRCVRPATQWMLDPAAT